jgi:hypothetical protein
VAGGAACALTASNALAAMSRGVFIGRSPSEELV